MSRLNALIIDDNANNILVLQQLLTLEGVDSAKLSTANNLLAQLDMLPRIDIVFLDLELPGVNGYEALEILHAHAQTASAKIVAYSVHISELHNVIELGFDGFIGKPLNSESFSDQLWRILNGEKVWYSS